MVERSLSNLDDEVVVTLTPAKLVIATIKCLVLPHSVALPVSLNVIFPLFVIVGLYLPVEDPDLDEEFELEELD